MSYSVQVTLTAPLALSVICAAIARGMDTDIGGSESFRQIYPDTATDKSTDGNPQKPSIPATHLEASFWATPEFSAAIEHLMNNPEALQASIAMDYSKRWPDFSAPTLADCNAFCKSVILVSNKYD